MLEKSFRKFKREKEGYSSRYLINCSLILHVWISNYLYGRIWVNKLWTINKISILLGMMNSKYAWSDQPTCRTLRLI